MGIGSREGEDMRRHGLSKTDTGSMHTRRPKRAAAATSRRSSPLLRAVTAPARDRRDVISGPIAVSITVNGAENVSNKESNDNGNSNGRGR